MPALRSPEVKPPPVHRRRVTREAMAAFDHTCRHYLRMSGEEFLRLYDAGQIDTGNPDVALRRVLSMLPFAR